METSGSAEHHAIMKNDADALEALKSLGYSLLKPATRSKKFQRLLQKQTKKSGSSQIFGKIKNASL